ncbi:hypothetical protein GGR51DRAFT_566837 [Nemania sp. FL0031]|nr:hypothetical protein GGR51DRAFT_566837 [Nemania sp. FL0031]
MDESDFPLVQYDWPNGNVYLVPTYLKTLQGRLENLKGQFKKYIKQLDPEAGFDLAWILVHISEPAFLTIQFIAEQAPPLAPVDKSFIATANALVSKLRAEPVEDDDDETDETLYFLPEIQTLPNAQWDAVFKGYCKVLEASVDAFVLGDSPTYRANTEDGSVPGEVFHILRDLIADFDKFPFLRLYQNRLIGKLEDSSSGAVDFETSIHEEAPPKSESVRKRKIKLEDFDDGVETPGMKSAKLSYVTVNPYT